MTQTNTNQQAIAAMKNVMMVTIARIENAQTLMWITTKVKWSFISYVKMALNGKKYGHTKGASGLINTDKYENMRLLFLEFSDSASDEVDEEAWNDKLTMLDELLAEVIRLREAILEFADCLEEKVRPYMTMYEVVPMVGGMVSDLHKMIERGEEE